MGSVHSDSHNDCLQELGIPTANLSEASIGSALGAAVTGIYYGWASVGSDAAAYQMVMSVGFNPFYKNSVKTCEPWLLHEFAEVLSSSQLRIVLTHASHLAKLRRWSQEIDSRACMELNVCMLFS